MDCSKFCEFQIVLAIVALAVAAEQKEEEKSDKVPAAKVETTAETNVITKRGLSLGVVKAARTRREHGKGWGWSSGGSSGSSSGRTSISS